MADGHFPEVLALIVCEGIIVDMPGPQVTIVRTLKMFCSPTYPFVAPGLAVYTALTECRGDTKVEVRCIDPERGERLVFQDSTTFPNPDPVALMEAGFRFKNIVFEGPGFYSIGVYANGELLKSRRLLLAVPE